MSNDRTHGAFLAEYLGGGVRFQLGRVTSGGPFVDGEKTMIAIYPASQNSFMSALMAGCPVFEFDADDEDKAEQLLAALNYFAPEKETT